jgi:DNA polymerase III alpha subunit (gram-positive type)
MRRRAIHGISDADVRNAPPFAGILSRLSEFVAGAPLVGFNVGFDLDFLAAELERAGMDPGSMISCRSDCDLMAMAIAMLGHRRNLLDTCRAVGVDLSGLTAHDEHIAAHERSIMILDQAIKPIAIELDYDDEIRVASFWDEADDLALETCRNQSSSHPTC